ncbi:MAG: tRNA (adenosine(37)-N6)-threonylcarbamoyltransferase complex transferase subunit TsaD [Chlamydiales bacterium]
MLTLGIESTCDETGAAIVKDGRTILSNVLASSADLHAKYGGVFPELACRRHTEVILPVIDEAMSQANVSPDEIDLIAVAKGPGLVGALLIGMHVAKGLSIAWKKPLIGVNHVESHLYASMMHLEEIPTPALGIVLSGGHTLLVKILSVGEYQLLGTTVDDAIGEAFDKVATLLGLPYPGGPHVEQLALRGDLKAHSFNPGRVKRNPLDFSFSGLKTAVLYAVKGGGLYSADLAAAFQETAFKDVANKAYLASKTFPCQAIFMGGGVTANRRLRKIVADAFPEIPIYWPPGELSLDNAAMIAGLGARKALQGTDSLDLEVQTRIPFA